MRKSVRFAHRPVCRWHRQATSSYGRMKTKDGEGLIIIAGVSVTRTLHIGTPEDVKHQLTWLVENGPETGLLLAGTSSVTPGAPWENIQTFVEGLKYYRTHGRT